jgi:ABC-type transport system, involved in lipoprotein release, permease component
MKGMNLGVYEKAINSIVHVFTGYAQITSHDYWDDQSIENIFDSGTLDYKVLEEDKNITNYVNRLQSFALSSFETKTKGVMVVGADLEQEDKLTQIKEKLVEGEFFSKGKNEVVVAKTLASYLGVTVGDTLVLIGQGYHGASAAGKFEVKGILHFNSYPDLDKQALYMDLTTCQEFYSAAGYLSSVVLDLDDPDKMERTTELLISKLTPESFDVVTWHTMLGDLRSLMKSDIQNNNFLSFILYLVVAFGIFGTVLMMTVERRKEFAVMIAVGMQKWQLRLMLILEMVFIALLAIIAVIPFTLPFMYYLNLYPMEMSGAKAEQLIATGFEPYMPVAWHSDYIIQQMVIVFCIVCIASIYPVYRATKGDNVPDTLKN